MERSVQLIVGGGVALVAGLWLSHLSAAGAPPRYGGVALALVGLVALAAGIARDLTALPFDGRGPR